LLKLKLRWTFEEIITGHLLPKHSKHQPNLIYHHGPFFQQMQLLREDDFGGTKILKE
jgi:hypothetical protein